MLSLGVSTSTTQHDEEPSGECMSVPSETIPLPPSSSREVDRHAYLQEKNRRAHLEKRRQQDIIRAANSTSQPNKKKTICLGKETQKSLTNPDQKNKISKASSKTSLKKVASDKLAKKPSDDKWEADMKNVEVSTSNTKATESPNAPPPPER
jgi:hypothetical protein